MGYSFTVPCKSKKARNQVHTFMDRHFRSWSTITKGDRRYDPTTFVVQGDGIAYGAGASKIGFNYSNSHQTGHYMMTVLRFFALRMGRKRTFKKYDLPDDARVPYICRDSEAWPALLHSEWDEKCPEKAKWCLVDENGYKPEERPWRNWDVSLDEYRQQWENEIQARDVIIKAEVERLAKLWEAEFGP